MTAINEPQWSDGFNGFHFRVKSRKKESISGNFLSCWKKSDFYQDTNATVDETSTYEELAVPAPRTELPYHNTTLKWIKKTWQFLLIMHQEFFFWNILTNQLLVRGQIYIVLSTIWYDVPFLTFICLRKITFACWSNINNVRSYCWILCVLYTHNQLYIL